MGTVNEGSISLSDMSIQANTTEYNSDREWRRLRFEAGKSYRIKIIDPTKLEVRKRHYQPLDNGKKGYYRCLQHTGYCPVCQAASDGFGGEGKNKLKKAQEVIGANVLVYNTDANGNPVQPLNAEVYFWSFNVKKFVELRSIQQEWGDLSKIDLKLTCADDQAAQFQNVSIQNCAQCLYESDPAFKAACDAKIEKDKYPLAKMICKEVDLPTMIQTFGLPASYYPQDMLSQMPQGQQTVNDLMNGTQPVQAAAPVQQATPVYQAPVQQAPVQQAIVQPIQQQAPVNEIPFAMPQQAQPLPNVAPVQQAVAPQQVTPAPAPQVQADAYAPLDELQAMLN